MRNGKSNDPEIVAQVRAIFRAGGTISQVKREVGISYPTVDRICQKHRIKKPKHAGRSVVPDDLARRLAAEGKTLNEIADACGCTSTTVKRWAELNNVRVLGAIEAKKQRAQARAEAEKQAEPPPSARTRFSASSRALKRAADPVVAASSAAAPPPCLVSHYGLSEADRASLAGTGGRYRDLEAWAQPRGLTVRQAQQRWHALGLSVEKGASHVVDI